MRGALGEYFSKVIKEVIKEDIGTPIRRQSDAHQTPIRRQSDANQTPNQTYLEGPRLLANEGGNQTPIRRTWKGRDS